MKSRFEASTVSTASTPLDSGQYCGNCGQRARSRLISIWELTQEAFGDLLELDSRLWRTLIPLVAFEAGQTHTRDYLEGRRARFMPPFRTYLVLSIFFFLIAFFDPATRSLAIFFEPEAPARDHRSIQRASDCRKWRSGNEVMEELVRGGRTEPDGNRRSSERDGRRHHAEDNGIGSISRLSALKDKLRRATCTIAPT